MSESFIIIFFGPGRICLMTDGDNYDAVVFATLGSAKDAIKGHLCEKYARIVSVDYLLERGMTS